MNAQAQTTFPKTDVRIPPFAPVFGAMSLPRVQHAGEVSMEPYRGGNLAQDRSQLMGLSESVQDPIPETLLGIMTAGLSGAATGGLAAGSWRGAGIGTGVNVAMWSLFNLVGSWRTTGAATKAIMGSAVLLSGGVALGLVMRRRRGY